MIAGDTTLRHGSIGAVHRCTMAQKHQTFIVSSTVRLRCVVNDAWLFDRVMFSGFSTLLIYIDTRPHIRTHTTASTHAWKTHIGLPYILFKYNSGYSSRPFLYRGWILFLIVDSWLLFHFPALLIINVFSMYSYIHV